jgi:hypothetical protein
MICLRAWRQVDRARDSDGFDAHVEEKIRKSRQIGRRQLLGFFSPSFLFFSFSSFVLGLIGKRDDVKILCVDAARMVMRVEKQLRAKRSEAVGDADDTGKNGCLLDALNYKEKGNSNKGDKSTEAKERQRGSLQSHSKRQDGKEREKGSNRRYEDGGQKSTWRRLVS